MLDLMDAGAREKDLRELGEKATGVFNRLVKNKKVRILVCSPCSRLAGVEYTILVDTCEN